MKPQLACHWSVGKVFFLKSHAQNSRESRIAVTQWFTLCCALCAIAMLHLTLFQTFPGLFNPSLVNRKLCNFFIHVVFFSGTAFRTTNQTMTAGKTPFATICRLIRISAKATRLKLGPGTCGRFRVVSLKRTSWHGNTLVFLESIEIF